VLRSQQAIPARGDLPATPARQGCEQCPGACLTSKINFKVNRCNAYWGKPPDERENRSQRVLNHTPPATAGARSSPFAALQGSVGVSKHASAPKWQRYCSELSGAGEIIYQDFPAATGATTDDFCARKTRRRKLWCYTNTENCPCHQSSH